MGPLLKKLKPEIDATIARLKNKKFKPDPIAGRKLSRITSVLSSAYKRHGFIIERAIVEQLKRSKGLEVWEDDTFQVPSTADHIVDTAIADPESIFSTATGYRSGHRTLQVDAIVYDKKTKTLRAYEIKRGSGLHDSGKRRSILRDLLCLQTLLKSYGESKGYKISRAYAHIIFYYGECSIGKPFSLVKEDLDSHFGRPVLGAVEEVNEHFKKQLLSILT